MNYRYTDLMIFRKVPLGFMKNLKIKQKGPLRAKARFWGSRTLHTLFYAGVFFDRIVQQTISFTAKCLTIHVVAKSNPNPPPKNSIYKQNLELQ